MHIINGCQVPTYSFQHKRQDSSFMSDKALTVVGARVHGPQKPLRSVWQAPRPWAPLSATISSSWNHPQMTSEITFEVIIPTESVSDLKATNKVQNAKIIKVYHNHSKSKTYLTRPTSPTSPGRWNPFLGSQMGCCKAGYCTTGQPNPGKCGKPSKPWDRPMLKPFFAIEKTQPCWACFVAAPSNGYTMCAAMHYPNSLESRVALPVQSKLHHDRARWTRPWCRLFI